MQQKDWMGEQSIEDKKNKQVPFNLASKTTLWAPLEAKSKKIALQHAPGEMISIHPVHVDKFKSLGYTETPPDEKALKEAQAKAGASDLVPVVKTGDPGTMTKGGVV